MNNLKQYKMTLFNQWIIFKRHKLSIILCLSYITIFLIFSILGLIILKSHSTVTFKFSIINLFIVLNSFIIMILSIFFSLNIMLNQLLNGVHKLELKNGVNRQKIFLSRLVFILILLSFLYLITFIISLLFFAIFNLIAPKDILAYRLYISSFGWYAIWSLTVISISILLSMFFNKESLIAILSSLICFIVIINISLNGVISKMVNSSKDYFNIERSNELALKIDYSSKLTKRIESNNNLVDLVNELETLDGLTIDQLMAGYKYWKNNSLNKFGYISTLFENIYKDSNILEWNDIIGFKDSNVFNENIEKVVKVGLAQSNEEYEWVFKFILNTSQNQGYYKYLELGYIPQIGDPIVRQILEEIQNLYTPDEYILTRMLIENLYFSNLNHFISYIYKNGVVNIVDVILKNNRNQKINNILNLLKFQEEFM